MMAPSAAAPQSQSAAVARQQNEVVVDPELVAFCDAQHPRVVRLLMGMVADWHVAEDLAQEVLLRVHLHWGRVSRADSPGAWVTRVAVNLGNSWWRRRYSEARANRRHGVDRTSITPQVAGVLAVRAAVTSLPRRQRTAVALRYFAELSVADTAEVMGCRPGTVKSLTSKGLSRLKDQLDRDTELDPLAGPGIGGASFSQSSATQRETAVAHDWIIEEDRRGHDC